VSVRNAVRQTTPQGAAAAAAIVGGAAAEVEGAIGTEIEIGTDVAVTVTGAAVALTNKTGPMLQSAPKMRTERKAKASGLVTVRTVLVVAVIAESVVSETAAATEGGITMGMTEEAGTMGAMAMAMVIAETAELEDGTAIATINLGAVKCKVARVSWCCFEACPV
jgi:hypothetical protein